MLSSLGGLCAGCPNHPPHGPAAPWKGSLQQERPLPRAKDAGAQEGERQDLPLTERQQQGRVQEPDNAVLCPSAAQENGRELGWGGRRP